MDPEFPKRNLQYFYRIYDRYDRDIVAMVIQTGIGKRGNSKRFRVFLFRHGISLCVQSIYIDGAKNKRIGAIAKFV